MSKPVDVCHFGECMFFVTPTDGVWDHINTDVSHDHVGEPSTWMADEVGGE